MCSNQIAELVFSEPAQAAFGFHSKLEQLTHVPTPTDGIIPESVQSKMGYACGSNSSPGLPLRTLLNGLQSILSKRNFLKKEVGLFSYYF